MFHSYNSFGAPNECGWCGKNTGDGTVCTGCQAILDQWEVERQDSLRSFALMIVDAPNTPQMLRDAARTIIDDVCICDVTYQADDEGGMTITMDDPNANGCPWSGHLDPTEEMFRV